MSLTLMYFCNIGTSSGDIDSSLFIYSTYLYSVITIYNVILVWYQLFYVNTNLNIIIKRDPSYTSFTQTPPDISLKMEKDDKDDTILTRLHSYLLSKNYNRLSLTTYFSSNGIIKKLYNKFKKDSIFLQKIFTR